MSNVLEHKAEIIRDYREGVLNFETIRAKYNARREDMVEMLRSEDVPLRGPLKRSPTKSGTKVATVGTKILYLSDNLTVGTIYESPDYGKGEVLEKYPIGKSVSEYRIKFGGQLVN
jgi:hypothetical protein